MVTLTQPSRRVKPTRTIRLALPPSDVSAVAVMVITVGKAQDTYHVTPIRSDFGAAFEVAKVSDPGQPVYQVCLEGNGGTCNCKGHSHRGTCRHVEGLAALRRAGKL
jgi:hypothetical protein